MADEPTVQTGPAHGGSAPQSPETEPASARTPLREIAALFFRLGATAFGGPAAYIAMMQDEAVRRRRWLTDTQFLDLLGAANLIPGPNATELAIHIGWARGRWPGLLLAGLAFIVPAAAITWAFGWMYVRYGSLPEAGWILYGVKPVIMGIIVQALWALAPRAARSWLLRAVGALGIAATAAGVNEIAVLFASGLLMVSIQAARRGGNGGGGVRALAPFAALATLPATAGTVSLSGLFWVFCKIGAVLYGSGYVLFAFLRSDLVERLHWMTEAQLIDAIAVGQITPGPLFSSATFVGYLLAGSPGAVAATAGIFLPSFFFVAVSGPLVPKLRASPLASAFLDGVNVASLALMAVVTVQLAGSAFIDLPSVAIGVLGAVLLLRYRLASTWLILGGAVGGALVHLFR